jgi:hypothetical protein
MAHFAEENWADYVRGFGAKEIVQQMSAHLTEGCADCKKAEALWNRLHTLGNREAAYTPSSDLVRLAKLQFAVDGPVREQAWAAVVFDTALQPSPVGVRGGVVHARQVIYEAENLTVDLRFERKTSGSAISVSGQVLDRQAPMTWVSGAVVVLWTEAGRMVTKTEANECGEFQLEFEPREQLRMSVITMERKTLRIVLGSFD